MTNYEYMINALGVEGLAALLVCEENIDEGSECCGGEWESHWVKHYKTPNGQYCYDYEDAVNETIKWLNSERQVEQNDS